MCDSRRYVCVCVYVYMGTVKYANIDTNEVGPWETTMYVYEWIISIWGRSDDLIPRNLDWKRMSQIFQFLPLMPLLMPICYNFERTSGIGDYRCLAGFYTAACRFLHSFSSYITKITRNKSHVCVICLIIEKHVTEHTMSYVNNQPWATTRTVQPNTTRLSAGDNTFRRISMCLGLTRTRRMHTHACEAGAKHAQRLVSSSHTHMSVRWACRASRSIKYYVAILLLSAACICYDDKTAMFALVAWPHVVCTSVSGRHSRNNNNNNNMLGTAC